MTGLDRILKAVRDSERERASMRGPGPSSAVDR
jgi:hypothetical protein